MTQIVTTPTPTNLLRVAVIQSAAMIERLPAACFAPGVPGVLQLASIEGFYANARSLIEFLGHRSKPHDSSAKDIDPSWQFPSDPATVKKLESHWQSATKHAVHYTKERVQTFVEVNEQTMKNIADDVLTVWDQFAANAPDPLPTRGNFPVVFRP